MKINKKICWLAIAIMIIQFAVPSTQMLAKAQNDGYDIVQSVVEFINDEDVINYISLFDSYNQNLMNEYVSDNGTDGFFQTEHIELLEVKELSYDIGISSAQVSAGELENYTDIQVYYTKEQLQVKATSDVLQNGISYKVYVLGLENGERKIIRISAPTLTIIGEAGESFENEHFIQPRALLTLPSTICVYFTKTENINYHNQERANISFNTYLKNVIPIEWTVSRYSVAPAYLYAGAMASKMYAWYNTINSKRNYAPYYSHVLDNTNDQGYLATSYSGLSATYRSYVDSTMSTIGSTAMVTGAGGAEDKLFEAQYRMNSGVANGGILNESTAWQLAQQGYTYQNILRYFYDYSSATGNNAIYFRAHS